MRNLERAWRYFNSIKVQLELISGAGSMLSGLLFQFHKGTIRTLWLIVQTLWVCNFNSIKVQLELNNASARNMVANFNSIKVQLEHAKND